MPITDRRRRTDHASGGPQGPPSRSGWRALLLPSALALAVLGVLLGLGTWQMQRLAWKQGVLAELARTRAQPPIPAPPDPPPFAAVTATGRFRPGAEGFLGLEVRGAMLGGRLIAVLDREGAPPLLVERGWAPFEGVAIPHPAERVTVTGYARPPERRSPFAAADDLVRRRFLSFDPQAIARALGAPDAPPWALVVVEPATRPPVPTGFGAAPPPMPATLPDPATGFPEPGNPHLGYALTWYGLAAGWVAIFALWARRRLRGSA